MKERKVWIIDQKDNMDHFEWQIFESEYERGFIEIWLREINYETCIFVVGMKCTKEEAKNWIEGHYGQKYIQYYKDKYM